MPNVILAALSGTLLALSFPYPSLWPLAWVALVPLLVALSGRGILAGFALGYVFGVCFMGITLRWSAELDASVGWVLWALFVLIEAIIPGVFGALAAWLLAGRAGPGWRPVSIACAWTTIEYLRVQGPYALTWSQLSYSQLPTGAMVQMADLTGAIGVTFVIVLVNAVLADIVLWREQNPRGTPISASLRGAAVGTVAVVLIAFIYGVVRAYTLPASDAEAAVVACIQPNDDPHEKWNRDTFRKHLIELMGRLEAATQRVAYRDGESGESRGAYLVIWPETAVPEQLTRDPEMLGRVRDLAKRLGVYILVGCTEAPPANATGPSHLANTALLFDPDGNLQGRYDKMHLVPFGEFLPLRSLLERVPPFNEVGDLYAGDAPTVFRTSRFNFATLICFESTFSDQARDFVRAGAQLLVVITNDGWFNRTSAAEHHLAMSAMRAIEERIWLVQCGNTGISAFIGPRGEVYKATELFVPTEIKMAIQPGSAGSIYQRFGDWFPMTAALCLVGLGVLRWRAKAGGG